MDAQKVQKALYIHTWQRPFGRRQSWWGAQWSCRWPVRSPRRWCRRRSLGQTLWFRRLSLCWRTWRAWPGPGGGLSGRLWTRRALGGRTPRRGECFACVFSLEEGRWGGSLETSSSSSFSLFRLSKLVMSKLNLIILDWIELNWIDGLHGILLMTECLAKDVLDMHHHSSESASADTRIEPSSQVLDIYYFISQLYLLILLTLLFSFFTLLFYQVFLVFVTSSFFLYITFLLFFFFFLK